jgi:predicted TIM-barrel enzyme
VETATDQGFWDGTVSRAEQQSIHRISGHNDTTAKVHYVKHSRSVDVRRANAAFERMFGTGAGAGATMVAVRSG